MSATAGHGVARIFAITGTNGAGKGTVVEFLQQAGFSHYSARSFITAEILSRGLPATRDNMIAVANDLRSRHKDSYIIERLLEQAQGAGGDAVVESVRTVGELAALRAFAARSSVTCTLLAVDASLGVRFSRVLGRGTSTDSVSLEDFRRQEAVEMASEDPAKQNLAAVMRLADALIQNDGSREDLAAQVSALLSA